MINVQRLPSSSSDFRHRLQATAEKYRRVSSLSANDVRAVKFPIFDTRPSSQNTSLIAANNHHLLIESREDNIYGEDCIPCRETYRHAYDRSRALVISGVVPQNSHV